ncbi:MAG: prolipoprotein diacylglyceryl transferase [Nocardioides sp.]
MAAPGEGSRTWRCGSCPSASSAAGSTTSRPTGGSTSAAPPEPARGGALHLAGRSGDLGAVALGAVGAWIAARRVTRSRSARCWTRWRGVLVAQAIGRWGNWFNQELFGRPTDLPWGLEIDPAHRPEGYLDQATFHPTFLYESLWDLGAAAFVIWADRRFRLGHGRVLALYVMAYTAGRAWIEDLRIDPVQMNDVLGLRLNVWTSILLFVAAAAYFVVVGRRHPGREEQVYVDEQAPDDATGVEEELP